MQMKPSDFLVLCGFVLGGLIAIKKTKKFIGWFIIIASGTYLVFAVFSSSKEDKPPDKYVVTATVSGNGQAQAAGHDIVNGVSDSTLKQVLNLKDVELSERMLTEYPFGCVVLGLENGKVVYDARLKDGMILTADWDNATIKIEGAMAHIHIPNIKMLFPARGSTVMVEINDDWQFIEGVARQNRFIHTYPATMYYEVMDASRGITTVPLRF